MPALAYAALIRIVRSLEESELYPHEVDILRSAADARLLADQDREERTADADELLGWLVESERLDPEVAVLVREQLRAITSPAAQLTCEHVQKAPARRGSLLGRVLRAILGLPVAPPPASRPAPAAGPTPAPVRGEELLDEATLAALAALDEMDVAAAAAEGEAQVVALDAAGRPFDPDRLHEQAENLLAFHAWLEENDRR